MSGRKIGTAAMAILAMLGLSAWAVGWPGARTEPAPVDVLLEAAYPESMREWTDGVGAAAAKAATGVSTAVGSKEVLPRAGWDLPVTHNARVQHWIDFLAGRNAARTRQWLEREGKYGGFIRGKLRERDMPEDLLYLVMIESGLSPRAYSRAHAAGLWQFIAETGRRYGLEVSTYVDARRDPIAATDAALDYLSDLYDRFGSWYLAAAGYNSGENRVERILRERAGGQKGDDGLFWVIDSYLPRETRDYVPLMLAAGHIAKDPGQYGFHGLEYQEPLSYEEVEVPGGTSLAAVARAAGSSASELSDLNTHLVRGMTPPGRSWQVRVPVGTAARTAANLEEATRADRLATTEHRVARGETLSHIARRHGMSTAALQAANPGVDSRRLQVGQRVRVPGGSAARLASADASASRTIRYRVRRGDTLWGIARRHGVSVDQLRRWNRVGTRIYPGQQLRIEA